MARSRAPARGAALLVLLCWAHGAAAQYWKVYEQDYKAVKDKSPLNGGDKERKPTPGTMVSELEEESYSPYDSLLKLADDGDASGPEGRRKLLQSKQQWQETGRYAVVSNPQMPGFRSSTGQVAIHAVYLPPRDGETTSYRIQLFGRNLPTSGPKSTPERGVAGNVSTVYDVSKGTYIVTPNYETLFCAGHNVMSDGNVLAAGGDSGEAPYPWMKEGRDVVRIFNRVTNKWRTLPGVKLSEYRWYPTQTVMPDERVLIVSGFDNDPARKGKPATGIDIFDYKTLKVVKSKDKYSLGKDFFTNVTPGYQLYPSVYYLPWTDPAAPNDHFFYFFTCRTGQVVRMTKDYQFIPMHNHGLPVPDICAQFSAMGSSLILPLRPENNYQVEIAMFGGGTQGKGMDCKGICNAPSANHVFRYKLPTVADALAGKFNRYYQFTGKQQWETMPYGRVFADAVLLPNGKVVVVNGAQRGVPGGTINGGGLAKDPTYTAILYDPEAPAGNRIKELATSTIKRYYHSNALLLQSGDVWIAGNEMSDCIDDCKTGMSPPGQEYRAEVLQLPYAFQPRPVIKSVFPSQQMYAQNITVWYEHTADITGATIIPPGANTHSLNMQQRIVFLKYDLKPDNSTENKARKVVVTLPPWAARVANPGYYMLWLLDGDVPVKEAAWIRLRAPSQG